MNVEMPLLWGIIYLTGLWSFLTVCQGLLSGLLQYSFNWSKAFLVSTTPCVMNSSSVKSLCSGRKNVLMTDVLALDLMLPGIAAQERRRRATRREAAWYKCVFFLNLAELNADHCDQLPGNMMRAQWWPTLLAALPTGSDSMCEGLRGGQGGRWPQSWQYLHPAHRQSPSGNTWKCGMRPRTVYNDTHSVVSHSLMLNQVLVIR